MKKIYEEMKIELLVLSADIVTLSDNAKDDVVDDIFSPNTSLINKKIGKYAGARIRIRFLKS